MATTTSILWTALPNGGTNRAYRLSIYVAPRLEGSGPTGTLEDYTLANWTARVQALVAAPGALRVELGPGGPTVPVTVPAAYAAGLDPSLWNDVFPRPLTSVAPRVFQDNTQRWIRSYSVRATEAYIQSLYDTLADASPTAFPDLKGTTPVTELTSVVAAGLAEIRRLGGLPGPRQGQGTKLEPKSYPKLPEPSLRGARPRATHPERGLETALNGIASGMGAPQIPLGELYRAYRFFRRGNDVHYAHVPKKPADWDASQVSPPLPTPTVDFHEAMAALGDHPYLLRKLGLIIDCVLPAPTALIAGFSQLQVVVAPRAGMSDITPLSAYGLSPLVSFRARPRATSDLGEGMLRLDNKNVFDVIQTDPDGNAIKVFDYAVNMHKVRTDLLVQKDKNPGAKSSQAPEETSVPALRSGGLTVVRSGRDDALWDTLVAQAGAEAAPETTLLFADDVVRGFRYDVQFRGSWYSLLRRRGTYKVAGRSFPQPEPDEGYVKAVSATSDAPDPGAPPPPPSAQKPDLYVHETVVGWHNWSLAARMPGKTIVAETTPDRHQKEVVQHQGNDAGAGFTVSQEFVPEPASLPPLRYGETYRFRARAVDLAGNSLPPPPSPKFPGTDAAPAGFGLSRPITYLRYEPVPAPALVPTGPNSPGESVQTMVVRHRSTYMPAAFPADAMLDETAIFNPTNDRWIAPPKSTVGMAEAHSRFDAYFKNPPAAFALLQVESGDFDDFTAGKTKLLDATGTEIAYPPVVPAPAPAWQKGDPLPNGAIIVHTEDPVLLPYLPDPLAHGVVFMVLTPHGAATGEQHYRAFDETGGWPNAAPFHIQLSETSGPTPVFTLGSGNTLATIQLPRGTMLTVRVASAIVPPGGDAGELTLMGRWNGMSDAGRAQTKANGFQHWMITPWRVLTLVNAVEKPQAAPTLDTDPKRILTPFRAPGDTFVQLYNGSVALDAPSTGEFELRARWDEFIDDPLDPSGPKRPVTPSKDGHVFDQRVDYDESPALIGGSAFGTVFVPGPKHELGDTKHRIVHYRAVGTTRYREFFPPSLTGYEAPVSHEKLITVTGPEVTKNVLSSARPAPPDVEYVVPTFKWIDTASGRVRQGQGLRVYFKRGWFSSGEGELLGVVLAPQNDTNEALRDYVSLWGADPIFDKNGPFTALAPSSFLADPDFPDAAPVQPPGNALALAEVALDVRVQGFVPQYDDARQLWFVDLNFDLPSAYYTFVRLALCRYQPDSLSGLQLSKVVRTELAQLLADRTASLDVGAEAINVTVSGPSALSRLGHLWNGDVLAAPVSRNAPATSGSNVDASISNLPPPVDTVPPIDDIPPIIILPQLVSNPDAGSGHLVTATIEWRPDGSQSDVAWQTLDGTTLASYTALFSSAIVYWKGTVRWPRPGLPTDREYRLVLRELELYQTDGDVAESLNVADPTRTAVRSRVVYVDIYPLVVPPGSTTNTPP
jgi:hypothetical protein